MRAIIVQNRGCHFDEPSLGLSPRLSADLFRTLVAIGRTGVGMLLVEQSVQKSLAISVCGYVLENGSIVASGTAEQLRSDPLIADSYLGR